MKPDLDRLRFKCPVPVDQIQGKKVHASLTRDNGVSEETGIGEIMVTTNADGMSLVWILFRDATNTHWIRDYLNEERVTLLKKADDPRYDFLIEGLLDAGPELT